MPRLFVAIDLPDAHKARLAGVRDDALNARWTPQEQFHLTLRFLGEVDDVRAATFEAALAQVHAPSFALQGRGLGVFPSLRAPRVLFAGIGFEAALYALQDQIEQAAGTLGLDADAKPFHPHVTLARLKEMPLQTVRAFLNAHRSFMLDPFDVTHFFLYESLLRPEGVLHQRRRSFALEAR